MTQPHPRQTNRLLGYPDDARLLILNADDFGMCHASNAAIYRSITEGVVQSTTLMIPCAWASQAMRLLRENPEITFGVHLTAIGDGVDYRWKPLTCAENVPSLVDETGHFYNSERMSEFFDRVQLDELEVEFRAQIDMVLAADLQPTHLDWHSLRIHRKSEIFDVMLRLAREYGFALRVRERPLIDRVRRLGLPCNDYDFLDSYFLEAEGKAGRYAQLLRELPEGLSEWAVHPGLDSVELQAIEPGGAAVRQADLDSMLSAEVREAIQQEGIILLDYAPLQAVWQGV